MLDLKKGEVELVDLVVSRTGGAVSSQGNPIVQKVG